MSERPYKLVGVELDIEERVFPSEAAAKDCAWHRLVASGVHFHNAWWRCEPGGWQTMIVERETRYGMHSSTAARIWPVYA